MIITSFSLNFSKQNPIKIFPVTDPPVFILHETENGDSCKGVDACLFELYHRNTEVDHSESYRNESKEKLQRKQFLSINHNS